MSLLRCAALRRYLLVSLLLLVVIQGFPSTTLAGMIGFPVPRQQPLHLRFELAGDSFKENLRQGDAEANSGRALLSVALGLTDWSEVYARVGLAEFRLDEDLFNGDFGLAYGGGIRVRLARFPFASVGLIGQYLRFTSEDEDSVGATLKGTWEEIDVGLGLGSRRFGPFQFYVGGIYHDTDLSLRNQRTGLRTSRQTDIPIRLLLGAHIFPLADFPSGQFLLNLELRLIGETPQFTLGIQYAF